MSFSGRTLSDLTSVVTSSTDPAVLDAVETELNARLARRVKKGKSEKRPAMELRRLLARKRKHLRAVTLTSASHTDAISSVRKDSPNPERREQMSLFPTGVTQNLLPFANERGSGGASSKIAGKALVENGRTGPRRKAVRKGVSRSVSPLKFVPTAEQNAAVAAFLRGQNLRINAFAGAGKTSTLALLSRATGKSGIYAAFNKACVEDSRDKFGSNVQCKTIHALAYRAMRGLFRNKKLSGRITPNILLTHVSIEELKLGSFTLAEHQIASLVLSLIRDFCQSQETQLTSVKVKPYGLLVGLQKVEKLELDAVVRAYAERAWALMQDPASSLALGHDGYLKLWALGRPVLDSDFILLDEAQDTNDVVLGVLGCQDAQVIYVGDRYQQIYEWRGAVNALQRVSAEADCNLTMSFRFGSDIAETANVLLRKMGAKEEIAGNPDVESRVGIVRQPNVIIARSNCTVLSEVLQAFDNGDIPYVEGGTSDLKKLVGGVYDLKNDGYSTVPEFFGFSSWEDVVAYSETDFGKDLAPFVQMVQTYGLGRLWHVLKNIASDVDESSVTISTAHKAKGREWDQVRLADDFVLAQKDENGKAIPIPEEEKRILYVAVTRAKYVLQLGEQTQAFLREPRRRRRIPSLLRKK